MGDDYECVLFGTHFVLLGIDSVLLGTRRLCLCSQFLLPGVHPLRSENVLVSRGAQLVLPVDYIVLWGLHSVLFGIPYQ